MSKADTLLKKATFFERMALYSDRKAFLSALAQDQFANIQVTTSGPYGQTIAAWLREAQQLGQKVQQAMSRPEPGTTVDQTQAQSVAGILSNATTPINLGYLLGGLDALAQLGGEGSGTQFPALANSARNLAARFRQAYTPRQPAQQAAMTQEAKTALAKATPLITKWQNLIRMDMINMAYQQDYEELMAASKELTGALAAAQSEAQGDNPYSTDADKAQAKASVAPLQKAKQQMDAVVAQVEKWRQTSAGFMRRVPGPTV